MQQRDPEGHCAIAAFTTNGVCADVFVLWLQANCSPDLTCMPEQPLSPSGQEQVPWSP